ncbi:Aste57867_16542 [Aphanomyces stellatus]|uniref:Aste57867_16542 protein n=1 Tax=Aphanomyces stellatus TaxID=120398 RepID=A0A485L7L2_9STRA|nr:hypothetical protein As57867_016485 [Aphanomyces stellatus]VFT93316.1 Aste57867_16542 [Aphanomyces stellatus]
MTTPTSVIEALAAAQLAAYNAKDLDAFCACYSEDVEVFRMPATAPALVGMAQFRANYVATFLNPLIQAHVPTRVPMGNKCMDYEVCVKDPSQPPLELMVIYEANKAGKICKATFFMREDH